MSSGFAGFPPEMVQFFRGLKRNNRRDWFQPRKHLYEQHVKEPMLELVTALNGELRKFAPQCVTEPKKAVFRIYRDTRFSADKTPYKTHAAAAFFRREGGGFYFSVSLDQVEVAGGIYRPSPETMYLVRTHIAENYKELAKTIGAQANLAISTHEVNLRQVDRILGLLKKAGVARGTTVAVLGLAYKTDTNIIDESQSVMLAKRLCEEGMKVRVYDPAALQNAKMVLGSNVSYDDTAKNCIRRSDACILATPWKEFEALNPRIFKGKVVLDCWRLLYAKRAHATKYVAVGIG